MKILIDTHFLIWIFTDTSKISPAIMKILKNPDNEIYYSQASLWEISIKYSLGKLELCGGTPEDFYAAVENSFLRCAFFDNQHTPMQSIGVCWFYQGMDFTRV